MNQTFVAAATPSRAFFIDMLTRDITVTDAILDLLDNAVDKAVDLDKVDVSQFLLAGNPNGFRGRRVEIALSEDTFSISDTCGGITTDEAANTIFRFGNPDERGADYGLSVYGIGMKRAFFKLGDRVTMWSAAEQSSWHLDWPVELWKADPSPEWTLSLTAGTPGWVSPALPRSGATEIRVSSLQPAIQARLASPTFERELSQRIAKTYALFLSAGLTVAVNGQEVQAALPVLAADPLEPARQQWQTGSTSIILVAGLSPATDPTPHGWYVFCNGRMVLAADKSVDTGWGDVLPQFRSKYNHFVGYLYFSSVDVRELPWRTTKQGVEREAPVYQHALAKLGIYAKPVIRFLNDLYPSDGDVDRVLERETLARATTLQITQLPVEARVFDYKRKKRTPRQDVNVQFRRPKSDIHRIREHLGDLTLAAGAIGSLAMDYYIDNELPE